MTSSETKFRNWAKKQYPNSLIKKIPDFKMMGGGGSAVVGLPDYVIFYKGETIWWEVKSGFGDTLNLKNHFTEGQLLTFKKMLDQQITVNVWCLTKSQGVHIITFKELLKEGKLKCKQ